MTTLCSTHIPRDGGAVKCQHQDPRWCSWDDGHNVLHHFASDFSTHNAACQLPDRQGAHRLYNNVQAAVSAYPTVVLGVTLAPLKRGDVWGGTKGGTLWVSGFCSAISKLGLQESP